MSIDRNDQYRCDSCHKKVSRPGETWLCVNRARHCVFCDAPFDWDLCMKVHGPGEGWAETSRLVSVGGGEDGFDADSELE